MSSRPSVRKYSNATLTVDHAGVPILQYPKDKRKKNKIKIAGTTATVGGQTVPRSQNFSNVSGNFAGDSMVVERTEAIVNVTSANAANTFKVESIIIHPCFSGFNWLKNFGNSYSEYEIHRMEFTYIPTVPTTEAGSVAMYFQSDIRDSSPGSLADVLSSEQSLLAPVYAGADGGNTLQKFGSNGSNVVSFELPPHVHKFGNTYKRFKVTTDGGMTSLLTVASGAVAGLYSPGELILATTGVSTASKQVGTLFVRYRIKFFGPLPLSTQA